MLRNVLFMDIHTAPCLNPSGCMGPWTAHESLGNLWPDIAFKLATCSCEAAFIGRVTWDCSDVMTDLALNEWGTWKDSYGDVMRFAHIVYTHTGSGKKCYGDWGDPSDLPGTCGAFVVEPVI